MANKLPPAQIQMYREQSRPFWGILNPEHPGFEDARELAHPNFSAGDVRDLLEHIDALEAEIGALKEAGLG